MKVFNVIACSVLAALALMAALYAGYQVGPR